MQQVAKNFREIFGELAPGGRAELVMQKRLRPEPQEENWTLKVMKRLDQVKSPMPWSAMLESKSR